MKGHNRKIPKVIKQLKGTSQPCRDDKEIKLPSELKFLPPPPKGLKGNGLIYYNQQGDKLAKLGLINEYNLATFLTICFLITKVDFFQRKMDASVETADISLYSRLYLEFQKNLRLSSSEFGLTPASASKVLLPKKPEKKPFDKFMDGK